MSPIERYFISHVIFKLIVKFMLSSCTSYIQCTAVLNFVAKLHCKYVLFTGWEVRIGKNCARGLEYGPRPHYTDRPKPVNNIFIWFCLFLFEEERELSLGSLSTRKVNLTCMTVKI